MTSSNNIIDLTSDFTDPFIERFNNALNNDFIDPTKRQRVEQRRVLPNSIVQGHTSSTPRAMPVFRPQLPNQTPNDPTNFPQFSPSK